MFKSDVQEVIISVNPPYSNMIETEEKRIDYRNAVIKNLKRNDVIYIYETKNKKGRGKIIGKVIVDCVIPMDVINAAGEVSTFYNRNKNIFIQFAIDYLGGFNICPTVDYISEIMDHMVNRYYHYPLYFDEWNSKQTSEYLSTCIEKMKNPTIIFKELGNYAYAILLRDFTVLDLDITDFISLKTGLTMKRPPQNMCRVLQRREHDVSS